MTLGDIIYQWRHEKEHRMSQEQFGKRIGTSRMYISMLENNYNPSTGKPINPSLNILKACADTMNIDLDILLKKLEDNQLIYLDEEKYQKQFASSPSSTIVFVYGTIPAGVPMECIEDIIDTEEIPTNMLKGGKQFFGLKIKGNSMFPTYLDNDTVIFEKADVCENGQDCVVMVNGNDGTFKRVITNGTGIILQPLNPEYEPMAFSSEQIANLPIRIIGIAREIRRKL